MKTLKTLFAAGLIGLASVLPLKNYSQDNDKKGFYAGAGPMYAIKLTSRFVERNFVNVSVLKEFPLSERFSWDVGGMYGATTNLESNLSYTSWDVCFNGWIIDTKRFDVGVGVGGGTAHWLNSDGYYKDISGVMNFELATKITTKIKLSNEENARHLRVEIFGRHWSSGSTSRPNFPNAGANFFGVTIGWELFNGYKQNKGKCTNHN